MSDIAIRIDGLGKQYQLGHTVDLRRTLRDTLSDLPGLFRVKAGDESRKGVTSRSGLAKQANEFWALRDINLEVKRGEVVGIIGRNGAGKSTLLKILSRITDPTVGHAEVHGRLASLLEVGTGFHPELTGRENIFLNGAILGMKRAEIERNFDEIVAFAEVEQFLDTPVKRYSSGMYVRLAFAVAAHLEPEIMIVDEVLSVGDVSFQKKCLGKMEKEAFAGRTILFVSHNMDAVMKLCNRGIYLEAGQIRLDDSVERAVQVYVAGAEESRAIYEIEPPENAAEIAGYAYRLTIEDARTSQPIKSVPVGCPWQIRIQFKINRALNHFIAAIGMTTSMGTALRTSWSNPQEIEPGEYTAVFRESEIILAPGQYGITLGLSEYESSFHYITEAGKLNIAEYARGMELTRIQHVGVILNPFKISIERV